MANLTQFAAEGSKLVRWGAQTYETQTDQEFTRCDCDLDNFVLRAVHSAGGEWRGSEIPCELEKSRLFRCQARRVLVIGMSENPQIRADFEDDLSSAITSDGLEAIPGNSILLRLHSAELDPEYLKGQIRDFKIDAVLISRLVKVDKKTTYTPGFSYTVPYAYYRSFYGYYGTLYRQVYSPTICAKTRLFVKPFLCSHAHGWRAYMDGHERFVQSEIGAKDSDGLVKLLVKELRKESLL